MFKAISDFFRKSCTDCQHYSWYREEDKVLPGKNVVRGELLCESCDKMDCRLNDLKACDMFKIRTRTHNSFHAFRIHTHGHSRIERPAPPKPQLPKG